MVGPRPTPSDPSRPTWPALVGLALLAVGCVPPVATLARRTEVADAAQFALFAMAVPVLVVIGAPWRRLTSLAAVTRRTAAVSRTLAGGVGIAIEVVAVVVWRAPSVVGAVHDVPALVVLEAASLLVAGVALWTTLVRSPPFTTCLPQLRLVLAAVAMWTVWIVAYVFGMGLSAGYPGFAHAAGSGLSAQADRQLATAVLFASAALAYMPVIFRSLFEWLTAEERRGAADTARRLRAPTMGVTREDARPVR